MLPLSDLIGPAADDMLQAVMNAPDDRAAIAAIENVLLGVHVERGRPSGDPAMRLFEDIAQFDSTTPVHVAAERLGISVRQLERRCLATFGHLPKTILRRSRFLDMATALRGFSDPDQELLAALRYFDQSHRTNEFKHFIGIPPGAFEKAPTPLLTAGLKLRAEGLT
jgi:AraC-like DNA-binding protein